jgi:hypothetical protein
VCNGLVYVCWELAIWGLSYVVVLGWTLGPKWTQMLSTLSRKAGMVTSQGSIAIYMPTAHLSKKPVPSGQQWRRFSRTCFAHAVCKNQHGDPFLCLFWWTPLWPFLRNVIVINVFSLCCKPGSNGKIHPWDCLRLTSKKRKTQRIQRV